MALDITKPTLDVRTIVEIRLTGKTLYFSDRHFAPDDANWYDGRLILGGKQVERFQSLDKPTMQVSNRIIQLDNKDQGLNDDLLNYIWGSREVIIKAGEGKILSDYSTVFVGFVQFPRGITRTEDVVTVTLVNAITRDDIKLPASEYTQQEFPNIDEVFAGDTVPIVYGDFAESPTNTVPVVVVDTTTRLMEVAGHTIGGINQVFQNGVAVAHSLVSLGPQARFTLTSYVAASDMISARIIGKSGVGVDLSGSTIMTHPVDQLYDLMNVEGNIPAGRIDKQSFIDVKNLETDLKSRRFLDESKPVFQHISELANEYSYDLYISEGSYTLKFREPVSFSGTLLRKEDTIGTFNSILDPDRLFANRILGKYNYDPANKTFNRSYTVDGVSSQTNYGITTIRPLSMRWQYNQADAEGRINRELLTYQNETETVTADFKHRSLLLELTGAIAFTKGHYDNTPMMIRGFERDWDRLRTRMELWNVPSFVDVGRWSSSPSYFASTVEQQGEQGYWCDEAGTPGLTHTILDTFTGTPGDGIETRLMDRGGTWELIDWGNSANPPDGITITGGGFATSSSVSNASWATGLVGSSIINGEMSSMFSSQNESGSGKINGTCGHILHWQAFNAFYEIQLFRFTPLGDESQITIYRRDFGRVNLLDFNYPSVEWADGHSILMTTIFNAGDITVQATNMNTGSVDALTITGQMRFLDAPKHGFYLRARSNSDLDMYVNDYRVLPGTTASAVSHWY